MEKKLKRFTEEEDRLLLENWWDPKRRRVIVEKIGRSAVSLNLRYYRLLKEKNIDPDEHKSQMRIISKKHQASISEKPGSIKIVPVVNTNSNIPLKVLAVPQNRGNFKSMNPDSDILPVDVVYGSEADHKIEALEQRMTTLDDALRVQHDQFAIWLENILYLYKSESNTLSMSLLMNENASFKEKIVEYQNKIAALEDQLITERENHEKVFKELDFWLGQFMTLSSIEKVATLGDFVPRLKNIVEKSGADLSFQTNELM